MKVKLAKTAGFCMGVRRALEMVFAESNKKNGPLFTLGPLIHNNQVLDLLRSKGVQSVEDSGGIEAGRIVIRAHGIPPDKRRALKKTGLTVIDATCPRVARVQAIIRYHTRRGRTAVIVGEPEHAEVIGLMGYSEGPVHVIQSLDEVASLPHLDRPFVVAQTTQNEQHFKAVVRALEKRSPDLLVFDTICDATRQRQQEVRSLKGHVDAVVVVGGYHSGNTRRLAQVAEDVRLPVFHVETEKDLDKKALHEMDVIGVTAGASTPNWMIKNVVGEIAGIEGKWESFLARGFKKLLRLLVLSNLAVALGAFSFALAAELLCRGSLTATFPLLAFLYVYGMHVMNRLLDRAASAYNDPERAAFLSRHRALFVITGIAAIFAALALAYGIGLPVFFTLAGLSLLGIVYGVPLIPEAYRRNYPYAKIKDIPGSRGLVEALGWTAVIAALPLLTMPVFPWKAAIITILIVFLMSYFRSALFDLFQAQGDLIVGIETLPVIIGEKKALALLKYILLGTGVILTAAPALRFVGPFAYLLLAPLAGLALCLLAYEKRRLYPGIGLEALVESNFFLAGLMALAWQAF
ncbi:MAG: 4-hydroxy-3-methylbut-2-enyl diphosphate reductase [Deltaproteobacteria bacterium]|nr:4-hydroxy-3-methylbut-2-enyl diphosphate reductase [Deltaproteobacteria bacterium]